MNPIGIMQGRLSPPANGRIQSFPVETWRQEFPLAREAGLACIEWIYESGTDEVNPLRTDDGIAQVREAAAVSGVSVRSICADYYMVERLVDTDGNERHSSVKHLDWLLGQAGKLGLRYIVLPFVDSSSLRSDRELKTICAILKTRSELAKQTGVELHLETDLPPARLVEVLESVNSTFVRANYDIGNSAALGRNPFEELTALGPWLGSVHVKDRIRGGHTVPLGTGDADFSTCFRLIDSAGFGGPLILQAARQPSLTEGELAKHNRRFVEKYLQPV